MSSPFALSSVKHVLQQQEDADALQSLGWLISSFLGPAPNMSLRAACFLSSTALLDWIWSSSCASAAHRPAGWSLNNYLRSDRHYERFEFAEAAKVAATRGDLPVIQWLFAHFSRWEGLASVIDEAIVGGHLEVVQFVLVHADASCQTVKKKKIVSGNGAVHSKRTRVSVDWSSLGCAMRGAIRRGHYAVARWIYENGYCGEEREVDAKVTSRAMDFGGKELADLLMLPDNAMEKFKDYSLPADLVGSLLECCRDGECAAHAIRGLAKIGRLDVMEQVAKLRPPRSQDGWSSYWKCALAYACERDDVPMIQWLMARSSWRELDVRIQKLQLLVAFRKAAERGAIAAMEYLHAHGLAQDGWDVDVMVSPARNGRVNAMKWLLKHGWHVNRQYVSSMIDLAAEFGHVQMMQFLYEMKTSDVSDEQRGGIATRVFWSGRRALALAIEYGHLAVVQWIHEKQPQLNWEDFPSRAARCGRLEIMQWLFENQRSEIVSSNAICVAAAYGHLEVVRWMLSVEQEHSTSGLLDSAVRGNSLELVQWLHENTDAGSTTNAMNIAARKGNLSMLKWLHAHRTEGCTVEAIEDALGLDDTQVAAWLVQHFPELVPQQVILNCQLDMLIFVRAHFPHFLEPEAPREGSTAIRKLESRSDYVQAWLKENYGGQAFRGTSGRVITF